MYAKVLNHSTVTQIVLYTVYALYGECYNLLNFQGAYGNQIFTSCCFSGRFVI